MAKHIYMQIIENTRSLDSAIIVRCDDLRRDLSPNTVLEPCVRMNIYDLASISPSSELYLLFSAGLGTVEIDLLNRDNFPEIKPNIYMKHNTVFFSVYSCNVTLSATTVDNEAKWDRKLIGENWQSWVFEL